MSLILKSLKIPMEAHSLQMESRPGMLGILVSQEEGFHLELVISISLNF